jgi:hypothetical protein
MSIWSFFWHYFCDFKTLRSHHRLITQHQNKNLVSKDWGDCSLLLRFQIFKHQNKFKKLWAFEVFSAIIFVISRLYGHTTGLILNTKIKTKSQKIKGTVLFYLGFKYSKTKINFKNYENWSFFCHHFCDFKTLRSHHRLNTQHQNDN